MPLLVLKMVKRFPPPCCLQTCRVLPYTLSVIAFLTAESLPLSLFLISKLYCAFCNSYPSDQCLPEALWVCWCAHYLCSLEQLLIAPCNCQIQCSEITWISFETLLENHSICCLLFLCCWQRFMPEIAHLSGTVFSEEPPGEYCQDEHSIYTCVNTPVFAPCASTAAWPGSCCAPWQHRLSMEIVLRPSTGDAAEKHSCIYESVASSPDCCSLILISCSPQTSSQTAGVVWNRIC